jgi:hypothetical protein
MVRAALAVLAIVALTAVAAMWLNQVGERWWQQRRIRTYKPRRYRHADQAPARTLNPARGSGPVQLPDGGPNDITYPLPRPLPLPPAPTAVGRVRLVKRVTLRRRNSRRY